MLDVGFVGCFLEMVGCGPYEKKTSECNDIYLNIAKTLSSVSRWVLVDSNL